MGLILVAVVVAVPVAYLLWRFRSGDESEAGGSAGRQIFGRADDDWGPQP